MSGGLQLKKRRWAAGFTLIEVMVALALFASAAVVLTAAYVDILNSLERVHVDQQLEEELALVRSQVLLEPDLDTVAEGGEVPTVDLGVAAWSADVEPTTIADLFRVRLSIELPGDGAKIEARSVEETLYLLRPDWSEPVDREKLRELTRERLEKVRQNRPL